MDKATASFQAALKLDPDAAGCQQAVKFAKVLESAKAKANAAYKAGECVSFCCALLPCLSLWPKPNTHTWASAGDYADAASQYKAAAATSQQFLPRGLSMLYNNLAAACLALKDDAGAVQACDKALQADPWNHKAYIRRADTLMVRQTKPNHNSHFVRRASTDKRHMYSAWARLQRVLSTMNALNGSCPQTPSCRRSCWLRRCAESPVLQVRPARVY